MRASEEAEVRRALNPNIGEKKKERPVTSGKLESRGLQQLTKKATIPTTG